MDLDAHPATTPEIRALCADLGVLGRVDFKLLLRWRLAVRKAAKLDAGKAALRGGVSKKEGGDHDDDDDDGDADADADSKSGSDSEDKLLEEMSEVRRGVEARERREKKKKAKLRAKERQRTALGLVGQDSEGATGASEMDLFSLARIRSKGGLDAVSKASAPGLAGGSGVLDSDSEDPEERRRGAGDGDASDSDDALDADARGDAAMEEELDQLWREYKARHTKKGATFAEPTRGRDKRVKIGAGELAEEDEEGETRSDSSEDEAGAATRRAGERRAAEAAAEAEPGNPLLFDPEGASGDRGKGGGKGVASAAKDWFAAGIFGEKDPAVGSATQLKAEEKRAQQNVRGKQKTKTSANENSAGDEAEGESDSDADSDDVFDDDDDYFADASKGAGAAEDEDEEEAEGGKVGGVKVGGGAKASRSKGKGKGKKGPAVGSDSDEDDYDDLREQAKAKKLRDEAKAAKAAAKEAAAKAARAKRSKRRYDDTYDDDSDSSVDDGGAGLEGDDPTGIRSDRARRGAHNAGFMEAPAEYEAASGSDSDEEEDDDPDDISDGEKAEILAIGKNMIRKKDRVRASEAKPKRTRFWGFGVGHGAFLPYTPYYFLRRASSRVSPVTDDFCFSTLIGIV
jgi:AdoMet-dependent rRNA methyltransferase SPB1